MTEQDPTKRSLRKRPLPKRFEALADDIDNEEKTRRPTRLQENGLDESEIPRYLRRDRQKSTGSLFRTALLLTAGLAVVSIAIAYIVQGEPAPKIPEGTKVDRGLAVLAAPRGFKAELLRGNSRVASESDGDRDGFVWFKDLPSASAPAGEYTLTLSAPGYVPRRVPVRLREGDRTLVEYSTDTDLKKEGS